MTSRWLAVASAGEIVTGLVLLADSPAVVRLLLGAEIGGAGVSMSRIAALALIGLGIACRPDGRADRPLEGMLAYSSLVTVYLACLAAGEGGGALLVPATALHAVLSVLLARTWLDGRKALERRRA